MLSRALTRSMHETVVEQFAAARGFCDVHAEQTKSEFRKAGLESAQAAVYRYGGVEYWREHFSVSADAQRGPVPDRRVWTEQRIERELAAYCAGRSEWPTEQQFIRDGKGKPYKAASLHGGVARCQKRLRLRPPRRKYPGMRVAGRGDRA